MTKAAAQKRIIKLRGEINYHRHLYHVLDRQEISDAALDSLKHELHKLEQLYPEFITPDSPTQRVAGAPAKEFKKVKHIKPVISIEDAFSLDEVKEWQERNAKLLKKTVNDYYAELKMDGLAVVLTYIDGQLDHGATRGNGLAGEDVTSNLRTIESIPLHLDNSKSELPRRIDVRGEVVIYKAELERINEWQIKNNLPAFANPRNLAAGTIRQLDPKITVQRQMHFFAFEIITDVGQTSHAQVHSLLNKWGFKTNPHCRLLKSLASVANYVADWDKKRLKLPYQTDGAVIVVNDIADQKKLGSVGKTERWMLAYKFPAEQATTKVAAINIQIGRTGVLTPVAHLTPVKLAGTTVSRATLHNEDEITRLDVRVGDTVVVQKAGDIIPDIVKVLVNLRSGKEKIFHMPTECPVCGTKVIRPPGEVAWYCLNKKCFAQQAERLRHFVSKTAFDIDGLGPKILDQLLQVGLVKDPADIFTLKLGDLEPLTRFAEKSAVNLITSINKAKSVSLARFIYALGIRHVGEETAQVLANTFSTLPNLLKTAQANLENLSDIGPVVAGSISDYISDVSNQKLISRLLDAGVVVAKSTSKNIGRLSGQRVVVTGTLKNLSRDQAKTLIRQAGGKVTEAVSSATNFLLAGANPGSKLDKAKQLGVKVISESEFSKLVS